MPEMPATRTAFLALAPVELRPDWTAVDSHWFSQGLSYGPLVPSIGLILTDTGHGHKAYLGIGLGLDLVTDIRMICEHGGRFPNSWASKLWPDIKDWSES